MIRAPDVALAVAALAFAGALALVLHEVWRRREDRLRRRPMATVPPAPATLWDRRIALHEAGHAVVFWHCTNVLRVTRVSIVENIAVGVFLDPEAPAVRWCRLVARLAGLAAELHVLGRFRTALAAGDLAAARDLAVSLAGVAPPWSPRPERPLFDPASCFDPPVEPAVAQVLAEGYRMALWLVRQHEQGLLRVASLLQARRSVGPADVSAVLGGRLLILLRGLRGAGFVVPSAARAVAAARAEGGPSRV